METDKTISPPNTGLKEDVFKMKNTFSNHGNEIEEIISNKPPLIVRWGTVYFFFVLAGIGLVSWFIKYPDIVVARAKLNSVNAPKEVITIIEGKLVKIVTKENEKVSGGQILSYMESIANPQSVKAISQQIDSINNLTSQNRTNEIINFFPDYTNQ